MTNDMRDWLSFVMSAVLFLLPLIKAFWCKIACNNDPLRGVFRFQYRPL